MDISIGKLIGLIKKFGGAPGKDAVVDATLTKEGQAADAKATGEAVSQLKDDLATFTGVAEITEWDSGYIVTNGETVDISSVTSSDVWRHSVINVSKGDQFTLNVLGGISPRGWCFTDSNYSVINADAPSIQSFNTVITAPENSSFLILNDKMYTSGVFKKSYSGVYVTEIKKMVEELKENEGKETPQLIQVTYHTGMYVNNVAKKLSPLDGFSYSDLITLNKGEKIMVANAISNTANVVDILSRWTNDTTYAESLIAYASANTGITTEYYTATREKEYVRVCYCDKIGSAPNVYFLGLSVDEQIANIKESIKTSSEYYESLPSVAMFETITVCGDSYVRGQIWKNGEVVGDRPNLSWGSVMGRLNGVNVSICASSGADTSTWQERTSCLPKLLSEDASGLYVFCLGINDYLHNIPVGTISDIHDDYTQNPVSYFGNYGRILSQAMAHAPNAKFIVMTPFYKTTSPYYSYSIDALRQIASHFGIMLIDTDTSELANSDFFMTNMDGGHPTSMLHSAMAVEIAKLIGICMKENPAYFCVYS